MAAFAATGCNWAWEVDDLEYRSAASASDAGGGQGGGSSGAPAGDGGNAGDAGTAGGGVLSSGGGGGRSTVCPAGEQDEIDAGPISITVNDDMGPGAPAIVAVGERFAIVYERAPVDELGLLLVEPDGTVIASTSLFADDLVEFEPSVAVTDTHILVPVSLGESVTVYRFTLDGTFVNSQAFVTGWPPPQVLATGSPNGALITYLDSPPTGGVELTARFLGNDGVFSLSHVFPGGGQIFCCASRRWAVGHLGGDAFLAAWRENSNATENRIALFNGASPESLTSYLPQIAAPDVGVPLGAELVFARCGELGLVAADGDVTAAAGFSVDADCAVGSTGDSLRVVELQPAPERLVWHSLDAAGAMTELLESSDAASAGGTTPALAFDGTGFGVAWRNAGDLVFAHVRTCASE